VANYTCPACRQTFHALDLNAPCIFCNHVLSEFRPAPEFHPGQYDLVSLARAQRWMLRVFPFALLGQVLLFWGPRFVFFRVPSFALFLFPTVVLSITLIMLMTALRRKTDKAFLGAVAMFVPVINVLVLIGLNSQVNILLKEAGLRLTALGVSSRDAQAAMDPSSCRGCGYNLTGNSSGRCPECGRDVRAMQRRARTV